MERAAEGKGIAHFQTMNDGRVEERYRQYKSADVKLYSNSIRVTLLPYRAEFPRNPNDGARYRRLRYLRLWCVSILTVRTPGFDVDVVAVEFGSDFPTLCRRLPWSVAPFLRTESHDAT